MLSGHTPEGWVGAAAVAAPTAAGRADAASGDNTDDDGAFPAGDVAGAADEPFGEDFFPGD